MWLGNYKLSVSIGNALTKEHFYELFINTIMYGTAKKINKLLNGFFTEATTILGTSFPQQYFANTDIIIT